MKSVFKWFVEGSTAYVQWFCGIFTPKDFDGIERYMFCFLNYCSDLNVVPSLRSLKKYTELDGIYDIKEHNIKMDTLESFNYAEPSALQEALKILATASEAMWEEYLREDLSDRSFKEDIYAYFKNKKKELLTSMMIKQFPRLQDGSDVDDICGNMEYTISTIKEKLDVKKINQLDFLGTRTVSDTKRSLTFYCKTGLPIIDEGYGGIYGGSMVAIVSQPGGGKTRLSLRHFVYPMLTQVKKDVIYDEFELKRSHVENILIAIHLVEMFGGKIKIPDSIMTKGEMTEEQTRYYELARADLFESGKYGQFIFRDDACVETLEESTVNVIRQKPNIGLWCIDYMGLMPSKPRSIYEPRLKEYEIITEGYKAAKRVLNLADICVCCVNQFNDSGIQAALAGRPIRPGDVQGGQIMQRHIDFDLYMTYTEEQKLAKKRMLSSGKTRLGEEGASVLISPDLSISKFV